MRMTTIRKTLNEELDIVMSIYRRAREFMLETGNLYQWPENYPDRYIIEDDIKEGVSYVLEQDGVIEAVFSFIIGEDSTYKIIEDGRWPNNDTYGTLHRIASRGSRKGVADECLQWCFSQCRNLRADTHADNKIMQHVFEKNGFKKCGIIYVGNGTPRTAYQKTLHKTYRLGHSGFLFEFEDYYFLTDYYYGEIPELDSNKQLIVLASHWHRDHLNFQVFSLISKYPNIRFIFSKDIRKKYNDNYLLKNGANADILSQITYIDHDETVEIGQDTAGTYVSTINSTDSGVAFIIRCEGKTIFHSGDLNWWEWDTDTEAERNGMREAFICEITKVEGKHFDTACLVLDPRLGKHFYKGFDYFMKHTDTDEVYPMHFAKEEDPTDKLLEMDCSISYRDKIRVQ